MNENKTVENITKCLYELIQEQKIEEKIARKNSRIRAKIHDRFS